MAEEAKTYRVRAACLNCGDKGQHYDIPIGIALDRVKCHVCGVASNLYLKAEESDQPTARVF
jgi:hypothetical protein